MLSAIAARKAAQAARDEAAGPQPEAKAPPTPPTPSVTPPAPKSNSKRKYTAHTPNPKRKKKEKRPAPKNGRYFEDQDAFAGQGDVIIIDSEEGEPMSDDVPDPGPSTSQQRWSPSMPLNDSSEEEGDDEALNHSSEEPQQSMTAVNTPDILSNLDPTPDENIFFLTPDEVQALNTSTSTTSPPATIVILGFKETLCLLGTYTFCVLQGSISCSGVTLSASQRIHRVFAPRSSPLPVLEGALGDTSIPDLKSRLPPRLHSLTQTPAALVLIQELSTGVEGLGRICRTFDGTFEPSRWQKNATLGSLQLSGVHIVSDYRWRSSLEYSTSLRRSRNRPEIFRPFLCQRPGTWPFHYPPQERQMLRLVCIW
jgi:polynucleotide 5'-hydroxyl-kinase GRC3/NOL9